MLVCHAQEKDNAPIVDHQGYPVFMEQVIVGMHEEPSFGAHSTLPSQLSDRSDPVAYAARNAPLIALAGVASGFQEAFYKFEVGPMMGQGIPHFCTGQHMR